MDISIPFNLIDVLIVVIAVISGVMASLRGFIREIFGLIGWVLAVIGARMLAQTTGSFLAEYIASDDLQTVMGWAIPFIIIALIWYIISNILSPPLRRFTLNMLDRPLGFIFGLARGIVIAALIYIGALFAVDHEDALPNMVKDTALIDVMRSTTVLLADFLPETISEEIIAKIPETIIDPEAPLESLISDETLDTTTSSDTATTSQSKTGTLLEDELGKLPTITDGVE